MTEPEELEDDLFADLYVSPFLDRKQDSPSHHPDFACILDVAF